MEIDSGPDEQVDRENMIRATKSLFYGLIFLTGIAIMESMSVLATAFFHLSALSALALISASLAENLQEQWAKVLDLIAVMSLLLVAISLAYDAVIISSMV